MVYAACPDRMACRKARDCAAQPARIVVGGGRRQQAQPQQLGGEVGPAQHNGGPGLNRNVHGDIIGEAASRVLSDRHAQTRRSGS